MKKIEKISEGSGYSAVSIGQLSKLNDYTLVLAPEAEIPGKVFIGEAAKATGAEVSFQIFEPGGGVPFLHSHKTHEELYVFVKGSGEFQIDGKVFPIAEGTIVRVAPKCKRTLRNTGKEPLIMMCVQYKAASFGADDARDGEILTEAIVW